MKLKILVFDNRRYVGKLSFTSKNGAQYEYKVCAQASPEIDGAVNPPVGNYAFIKTVENAAELIEGYGTHILFFQAVGGDASRTSNYKGGKFVLALHGGDTDGEDRLLPTEGGIRLRNEDLEELLWVIEYEKNIQPGNLQLEIVSREDGIMEKLTQRKVSKQRPSVFARPSNFQTSGSSSSDSFFDSPLFWLWYFDQSNDNHNSFNNESGNFGGGESAGGGAGGGYGDQNVDVTQSTQDGDIKESIIPISIDSTETGKNQPENTSTTGSVDSTKESEVNAGDSSRVETTVFPEDQTNHSDSTDNTNPVIVDPYENENNQQDVPDDKDVAPDDTNEAANDTPDDSGTETDTSY